MIGFKADSLKRALADVYTRTKRARSSHPAFTSGPKKRVPTVIEKAWLANEIIRKGLSARNCADHNKWLFAGHDLVRQRRLRRVV